MTDIQTIRTLCKDCVALKRFDRVLETAEGNGDVAAKFLADAEKDSSYMAPNELCQHRECVLWPYRFGRRQRPWPNRVKPQSYSPMKAVAMYRETLK